MADEIIVSYKVEIEGLKAQLKTVQAELKNVETKAGESAKAASTSFSNAGDTIKGIATNIATSLGLAFSVSKVIQFANESIKAFREAEEVAKKLEFAVTRIGKEGQSAFEKLNKQADIFAKKTIFSDETIRSAQTMLIQFGLNADAVEDLIPKIIDLASATGQDLSSATQLAIQGINGQGRALKPYGIILDDTGSKTQNLAILTDGLTKFTGSAGEAFNTAAGQAKHFDNEINELQESIGEKLSPLLESFEKGVLTEIDKNLGLLSQSIKAIKLLFGGSKAELDQAIAQSAAAKKKFLEEEKKENEKAIKQDFGLTQKGIDAKIAADKKANDEFIKEKERIKEINSEFEFDKAKEVRDVEEEKRKELKKTEEEEQKILENRVENNVKFIEKNQKKEEESRENKKQQDADVRQAEFDLISESVNKIFDYQSQIADLELQQKEEIANKNIENAEINADREIDIIDNKVKSGILTEKQGAEQKKAIEDSLANSIKVINDTLNNTKKEAAIEQAKRDKQQALFNIALSTAQAVISALVSIPPNVPLSIIVGAIGAVQAAAVLAKPIPKFAKGVIGLQGGVQGKDSIPAILMPGESVMTTQETMRHKDLLQSIRNDSLDKYLLENYINPRISDVLKENSTANNMAQSIKLNSKFPDEYALSRVMRRNKEVEIGNADYLASRIASELNKGNIKRTWS